MASTIQKAADSSANKIQKAAASKAVAKKDAGGLKGLVHQMQGEINNAVSKTGMDPERFARVVLSALSSNPQLQECTPASFLGAMMTAAQLGLEPNTPLGHAYLIPYRNKGKMEASFQLGYKGLIDLAYRSGQIDTIQAHAVHENDEFELSYGLEPKLVHKPEIRHDRGEVIGYYAIWRTKDGGHGEAYMSKGDIIKHRDQFSQAARGGFSPWSTNFDAMAKKTVIKQALKYAPLKSQFASAIEADGAVKNYDIELDKGSDPFDIPNEYVETEYSVDADGVIQEDKK